ncbi:LINC02340 isoform 3 [Pan troglodytes]|uniref:LINC02340 isoform 3 n=1 Tax=Pan troglodytes TaxID=9598 RepID=A0A2J8L557_PANTR|nr:LINC02340 isoform 3 [Pan troglodytes]
MKPRTLAMSVTVLKDGVSGVCSFRCSDVSGVFSFWWVRGLADFRSEAADLRVMEVEKSDFKAPHLVRAFIPMTAFMLVAIANTFAFKFV